MSQALVRFLTQPQSKKGEKIEQELVPKPRQYKIFQVCMKHLQDWLCPEMAKNLRSTSKHY